MLCEELELLEGELGEIETALENPGLSHEQRASLEQSYAQMCHKIKEHQTSGHKGTPCYEE